MTPDPHPPSTPDVEDLLQRFETEPAHPRHVCGLALALFDQAGPWLGGTSADRHLLAVAALLHDIGWAVTGPDGRGHHKATARLIREHPWRDLDPPDVLLAAAVARYHRKALPREDHPEYAAVPVASRGRVRHLAALLRVADALDRRHLQRVTGVTLEATPGALRLTAHSPWTVEPELEAVDRKGDLLRELVPGRLDLIG